MKGAREDQILAEAAAWHARIDQPDMDWAGFASWLDSAPEHQVTYDRLALLDDDVSRVRDELRAALPANDLSGPPADVFVPRPPRSAWRWWTGAGVATAALFVGIVVGPSWRSSQTSSTAYATGPAQTRVVTLKDGSSIRLDRNTQLAVSDGHDRAIRLDKGAAFFDVRHDANRPFVITSGEFDVRDLGTRFSVSRGASQLSVAVAQGLVEVRHVGKTVRSLQAGQQMDLSATQGISTVRQVDPASVASWREGRLIYDNAPLSLIVQDMSRYTRRPISVDPSIAGLTLSGVLIIGDGSNLVDQLQSLLPVETRDVGGGVRVYGMRRR